MNENKIRKLGKLIGKQTKDGYTIAGFSKPAIILNGSINVHLQKFIGTNCHRIIKTIDLSLDIEQILQELNI